MLVYAPFATTYTREPTRPSGGVQPGARALMEWTVESWDQADGIDDPDPGNLGIYNPRDICGNPWPRWTCVGSQHARGAAIDVRFPDVGEGGHPEGWKYARWLVANAAVLGVQEVIYARRRWNNQTKRWANYGGPSPHLDHVHAALNASGARYLTRARILSVAPQPPAPPAPDPEDDDMPNVMLAYIGPKTRHVCQVSAARDSVVWVPTAAAVRGAKTMLRGDTGDPKAGAVCRLNPFDTNVTMAELAKYVLSLPFIGPMPPGHANIHTGPHFPEPATGAA